jgi:hypothetical protein
LAASLPWATVLIGLIAGLLVVWGCLFVERVLAHC